MSSAAPVAVAKAIETWAVSRLTPYARNAKRHPPAQVEQLAASIREFGFTIPVLVADDGTIIAGHGRVLAAQSAGLDAVPVIVARGWTDAQRRAYTLADNKLCENGEWDDELLKLELGDLQSGGFDLGLTGFDAKEIGKLLDFAGTDGETDADDIPDAPDEPVSRPGDIWQLGHHRIICGDSTDAETVAAILGDEKPHLMVTDPPYGVEYDATWRGKVGHATLGKNRTGLVANDDRADWREVWALFPGQVAYVWHGGLMSGVVADSLTAVGFELRSQIIWNKTVMAMGRGDYHWKHEPCWYAVRGGGKWAGDRKQTTVWDLASPLHIMSGSKEEKTPHPTQKPVECMKRPIENNSEAGDAVYEPFSGSGTTIIAAEMTGRRCFAIELNPAYVDVAVKRWQAFAGLQAFHAETGEAFDDVAADRAE